MDKTINQQIEDLFLLHALDLEMLEVDQVISLRERFDDLRKRLVDLTVSADLMSGLPSSLDRRIGRVAKQAGEVIADFFEELTSESQSFMSDLAQAEASFGSTGFNTMLGTEYFGPTNNAENLAENLVVMGASIPDLFAAQSDALTRKYQQTITNAAKRGFSNEQLIARIRGTASAKNMRITEEEIEDSGRRARVNVCLSHYTKSPSRCFHSNYYGDGGLGFGLVVCVYFRTSGGIPRDST